MQRSQRLSMLSSRVNEAFTQLVQVFIFAQQLVKQDDSLHTHCANLNTLVARPITVEIWRTLEQVPYVTSHSPYGCLPQGVVVLFCWFFNAQCGQWGHLVTAPVKLFVVCSCLLTCDSTSTLHEALASLCLSQWLSCV